MSHCAHCDNPASPGTVQLVVGRHYMDTEGDVYLVGEIGDLFIGVSVDDFNCVVAYKGDGTPLQGYDNRLRLVEEVNYAPAICDRCDRPIETPEEEEDEDCDHNWVEVANEELADVEICTHCHAVMHGVE